MSTRLGEIQDGRESLLPAGLPGLGNQWDQKAKPRFYQKHLPPTHPWLTVPRNGRTWSARSVVLGDASVAAAQDHTAGDMRFLHRQAPPYQEEGAELLKQVDQGSGQYLLFPPNTFCLVIQMFMEYIILGSTTFSGSPLPTAF